MLLATLLSACSSDPTMAVTASTTTDTGTPPASPTTPTTSTPSSPTTPTTPTDTGTPAPATNRDRLLLGYLGYLQLDPTRTRSNGLRGADLADVCELWDALDPSAQGVFLTITARLEGSVLASDGSSMLDHVTTAYRVVGGEDATATDPGSCGGAEFNRVILSMDPTLHTALGAAIANQGGDGVFGAPDLQDIPAGGYWRDSHDLAGPHAPFTESAETEDGAPRGQLHFFRDPASSIANVRLDRMDVENLIDPYAFEMDHDYDCVHDSNPACEYTFYGPLCLPETTKFGWEIYIDHYGTFDPGWRPTGC